MKKFFLFLICAVWVVDVHATYRRADVIAALANADSVEVFSLAPMKSRGAKATAEQCALACFHGWIAVGQISIRGADARRISKNLTQWVRQPTPELLASCFSPRHGARLVSNGHQYDFVLCFECGGGRVYVDGKPEPYGYLYSPGFAEIWNRLLDAAMVERERPPSQ